MLVAGAMSGAIYIWDLAKNKMTNILEGHDGAVESLSFSGDGRLLASRGTDNSIFLWQTDTWQRLAKFPQKHSRLQPAGIAFHPTEAILATLDEGDSVINIWDLDYNFLMANPEKNDSGHYQNAKVVLVGDTGVGKSGLGLVLTGREFAATDSTDGRHVWTCEEQQIVRSQSLKETRETLLWDLAGQPGYRLIHQMHLNEVAVALLVCDARSETDPLAGIQHWDRALMQAHQRQGDGAVALKKFLVVARADRGGIAVSQKRIDALVADKGFNGYFETSAKEGWQIEALKETMLQAIDWDALPKVTSTALFHKTKQFIISEKEAGRVLCTGDDLFIRFQQTHTDLEETTQQTQFETCISRLENRDLIRRLSFGNYILLQPELLDVYASGIINAAKSEPDGLGTIAEEDALAGRFRLSDESRIKNKQQERLILLATIEELLAYDLGLREQADEGRYLVFPSQFNRDWQDAPEPPGQALSCKFEGPVQNIYATLAVRLAHSGRFKTDRTEMWRNAAIYSSNVRGTCGIYLREFAEGQGELILFYQGVSEETHFQFEEYVLHHLRQKSLTSAMIIARSFVCKNCDTTVPTVYASGRIKQGKDWILCGVCDNKVLLQDPKQRLEKIYPSNIQTMDQAADQARQYAMWLTSIDAEVQTERFSQWAGAKNASFTLVFTDVVGSTPLASQFGDDQLNEIRKNHVTHRHILVSKYHGREVNTLGDGSLCVFHSSMQALDFAIAISSDTGHKQVAIRAGLHIGSMNIDQGEDFATHVNLATCIAGLAKGAEIWVSDRVKQDIDQVHRRPQRHLVWQQQPEYKREALVKKSTYGQ